MSNDKLKNRTRSYLINTTIDTTERPMRFDCGLVIMLRSSETFENTNFHGISGQLFQGIRIAQLL